MRRVVYRLDDRLPHQGRRAGHAIEPRVIDHFDDRGDAASLFAHALSPRVAILDLARGVRAVPQLVFETLDGEDVAAAVGPPARHEETRQSTFGLRQS